MQKDVESATKRAEEIQARMREKHKGMQRKDKSDNSHNSAISRATTGMANNNEETNEPRAGPSGVRKSPKKKKKADKDKDKKRRHEKNIKEKKKKRRHREENKERLDRKALFAMKYSSIYRERDAGGKFKPFDKPRIIANQ